MTLDQALQWASRGFPVFPCHAGKKTPAVDNFASVATTEPERIRSLWCDPVTGSPQPYNVGVSTDDLVVLDLDVKNGHNGITAALALGLPTNTLTVRTPSGGCHLYFRGKGFNTASRVAPGVDTRGAGGYVLAPGSRTEAGEYTLLRDEPLLDADPRLLLEPARSARSASVELDAPSQLAQARHFLASAPPAVEGLGGHDTTYRTVCRVKDFGVSEEACLELMLEHWNSRCEPPWEPDELAVVAANGYTYSQNSGGVISAELAFAPIQVPAAETRVKLASTLRRAVDIPRRPWVVEGLLLRGAISLLVAEGAAGKSTLMLTLAAHFATGRSFLGYDPRTPRRVALYNAEDDQDEMERRLHAVCQYHGLSLEGAWSNLTIIDSNSNMQVTVGDPPTPSHAVVDELVKLCADTDVLMLDPFIELVSASDSDNLAMRQTMRVLKGVARAANLALLIAHHTNKAALSAENRAGNAAASRGAGDIINAARVALTMSPPSQKDCDDYGIDETERRRFIRVDDAKMNYTVAGGGLWLRKEGVTLSNGDEVGVLAPADLSDRAGREAWHMAAYMLAVLRAACTSSMPLSEAVRALQAAEPLYNGVPDASLKARLLARLRDGVELDGEGTIQIVKQQRGGREMSVVTLI